MKRNSVTFRSVVVTNVLAPTFLSCLLLFGKSSIVIGDDASAEVPKRLSVGEHVRSLFVDKRQRSAIVHVPKKIDLTKPVPLVLALHGAAMNGSAMAIFTGLNETADEKGFVVVYPNGSGPEPMLTWNAGGFTRGVGTQSDDVKFLRSLLEDLETVIKIDPKRVFACGMSNGAMMSYRLAAEMSDRIAAIAPVAGTLAAREVNPSRPMSVIHFHGTRDSLVPFDMAPASSPFWLSLKSVSATIQVWRKLDGCDGKLPVSDVLSKEGDELKVTRQTYGPGIDGNEVVLVTIEGGGHTWPGQPPPVPLLGKSTLTVSANELIWEFFQKHPMK